MESMGQGVATPGAPEGAEGSLGFEPTDADLRMLALRQRLPRVLEMRRRLDASRAARQIMGKYGYVDDLEQAVDDLEAREGAGGAGMRGVDPRLLEVLLAEKRSALARERVRFEHDLAASEFDSVAQANSAVLSDDQTRRLEQEVSDFSDEYAYTLSQCLHEGR